MEKEMGGFFEFEKYRKKMLYSDCIKLNCGRACLEYVIKTRGIDEIYLPYYNCDVIKKTCEKYSLKIHEYHIDNNFNPILDGIKNKWVYIVNYFGLKTNKYIMRLSKTNNIILDNAQAYFQPPPHKIDTIYSCRKFFGVSDGGILSTKLFLNYELEQDITGDRLIYTIGRFENNATKYYNLSKLNNESFDKVDLKKMSKITENLLNSFDYRQIKKRRTENFKFLMKKLLNINKLKVKFVKGAFCYPLYIENSSEVRNFLINNKVYIPILWPNVLENNEENTVEYKFSKNILPIPCDQRYSIKDMEKVVNLILEKIK